jgi:hypothetical protein
LNTRAVDAGFRAKAAAGRIGRDAKLPPQLGQTPCRRLSTQSRQNVHSKVQIMASAACGGSALSQHSQAGRNSSMAFLPQTSGIAAAAMVIVAEEWQLCQISSENCQAARKAGAC